MILLDAKPQTLTTQIQVSYDPLSKQGSIREENELPEMLIWTGTNIQKAVEGSRFGLVLLDRAPLYLTGGSCTHGYCLTLKSLSGFLT